mgnify:CR=1 FL=1
MALKFEGSMLDHEGFKLIKAELTEKLANAIQAKLEEMGDDAKGISWFSSIAAEVAVARARKAA